MSRRIVCDSCDERVKIGTTCVEIMSREAESPVPVTRHYHDLCFDRNVDVLLTRPLPIVGSQVMLTRREA